MGSKACFAVLESNEARFARLWISGRSVFGDPGTKSLIVVLARILIIMNDYNSHAMILR